MTRTRRRTVFSPAREALRSATARTLPPRPVAPRRTIKVPVLAVRIETVAPEPAWSLGVDAAAEAQAAVRVAREVFPGHPEAVDPVLGWLFARFPRFGACGSDMVAHHAMLRDERYYEGWVALCVRLRLFERDR